MDWSHVRFDWNRARAFLATVEEGSLSAAARALGVAQPTLGRQVTALESAVEQSKAQLVSAEAALKRAGLPNTRKGAAEYMAGEWKVGAATLVSDTDHRPTVMLAAA